MLNKVTHHDISPKTDLRRLFQIMSDLNVIFELPSARITYRTENFGSSNSHLPVVCSSHAALRSENAVFLDKHVLAMSSTSTDQPMGYDVDLQELSHLYD